MYTLIRFTLQKNYDLQKLLLESRDLELAQNMFLIHATVNIFSLPA